MAARLVVLAVLVVGCQCGLSPAINQGRRAQYYVQQSDGAYRYGYDTAEGLYQSQHGDAANEVRGQFGADGGKVEYTAGVGGYVVTSLKKPDASATRTYVSKQPVRYATLEELATHPEQVDDTAEVKAAKASFQAAYDAAAAAAEAAPDVNIITGPAPVVSLNAGYAYSAPAAHASYAAPAVVAVKYEGPAAPLDASGRVEDTAEVKAAKASFQAAYDAAAAAAEAAPDVNIITAPAPVVSLNAGYIYSAPAAYASSGPAPVVAPAALYSAPAAVAVKQSKPVEIAHFRSTSSDDGSYQFSYDTSSSSRHESADAANNVQGNFEFVADDSQRRRVDYSAGAATGFVASGAHLPVAVADTAEVAAAKASFRSAYDAAAAAAAAAPDDETVYSAPVVAKATYYTAPAPVLSVHSQSYSAPAAHASYAAPALVAVKYEGPAAPLDASGRVEDTAEVKAAKASFHAAYDAAAAAADAAPDVNIITGPAPVVSLNAGYAYSAPAAYASSGPAPVVAPAALYSAPAVTKSQTSYSASSNNMRTVSFDGITLMQVEGPAQFGYAYE